MFRLPFFRKGSWDAKVYASFIGSINWLRDNNFHHVAMFFLSALRDYGFKSPIPFVSTREDFGIYTTNLHRFVYDSHVRWNADWQVTEVRYQGIESRLPKADLARDVALEILTFGKDNKLKKVIIFQPATLEVYRLDQWWRSKVCEEVTWEESQALHIRPQETRLAPRWARRE
jgi:hypothetical protein